MDTAPLTGARRRFSGRPGASPVRPEDRSALARALLSTPASPADTPPSPAPPAPPAPASSAPPIPAAEAGAATAVADAAPPRGLYVLIPAGIDPADRRAAALEAAGRLALPGRPTAVFVFERSLVDAHVFGEPACGRLGPHNYLGAADVQRTVGRLVGQCDQVGVVLLDPLNGEMEHLGPAARRTVFMVTPDAESAVETYRTLKVWHATAADAEAALLVVGGADAAGAARVQGRLRKAAKGFLGCDLLVQGCLASRSAGGSGEGRGGLQILSQAPADRVWPALLDATGCGAPAPAAAVTADARAEASFAPASVVAAAVPEADGPAVAAPMTRPPEPAPPPAAVGAAPPGVCPAFALWHPADPAELIDALEAQLPGLLGGSVRQVLRVEVDEPGAPPLAAVRDDGALVAILLPGPDERVDTQAAEAWLRVHRRLLARAYPASGMAPDGLTAAMVLAPMDGRPEAVGVRRFVPVRLGGHRGIVLVP